MIAGNIGARSDQGTRSTNQDAYWVSDATDPLDLGELYIVTDGVGGQEFGAAAAQLAAQVINTGFYQQRQQGESVSSALHTAIHQANQAIYEQAQERGGIKMGCTVVVAVWHQNRLYVAHVGDARVYLLQKSDLKQLTRDDSWVQQQIDAGIITTEEAVNHEFRNVVTQALGNRLEITVHQSTHKNIQDQATLLLCTDGLHGVLSEAELIKLLKINPAQTAAETLVQEAIQAGTQDNVTAVVVQLRREKDVVAGTAVGQTRRVPVWAIVALVVLALLALAWGVFTLWPTLVNSPAPTPTRAATAQPILLPESTELVPGETAVVPTEAPPTESPPTDELVPTAEPTQLPPTEAPPTAIPSPSPSRGRIIGLGFLWSDESIQANDCQRTAETSIPADTIVYILEDPLVTVNGPDSGCATNEFIKIQSVENPELSGWILEYNVESLQPNN